MRHTINSAIRFFEIDKWRGRSNWASESQDPSILILSMLFQETIVLFEQIFGYNDIGQR